MKSVDYWCSEAVRLANPRPDANWATMKDPMAWLIEQIQKDAAQVDAARDEEIAKLREALQKARNTLAGIGYPGLARNICDPALEGK